MRNSPPEVALFVLLIGASLAHADPPGTSYVFPAGGQRGTAVDVRVGGLNLHDTARLHVVGDGVTASPRIERMPETIWFEGPLIRQPASQRKEDYPRDYAGRFEIAADAPGAVRWFVSNSQGVTTSRTFVVGDLPEIVEEEIDGDPIPVAVELPVTINGRIFPREDVDVWTVDLAAGETITCEVNAARLGSPLDSRLEVRGPDGRLVAANVDALGNDSRLDFTAEAAGTYAVRIHDVAYNGLQDYVYRLTLTSGPWIEAVYPLGGRRGETVKLQPFGANVPDAPLALELPADSDEPTFTARPRILDQPAGTIVLDLGDHPEHLEPTDGSATSFTVPATLNGRITVPGEADAWTFTAAKDEKLDFDLRAATLGSPLDSVLEIVDVAGRTLATNDDRSNGETDSRLAFTVPADGEYTLRVSERLASRGGPRFAYRIHATPGDGSPAGPTFTVTLPSDALTVTRGTPTKLPVTVTRNGYDGEIELSFHGLPEGITLDEATIGKKKPKANLALNAADEIPVGLSSVTVTAVGSVDETEVTGVVVGPDGRSLGSLPVAVAIPTPFSFAADFETKYANMGCVHTRRYRVERAGYDGPITVRLADVQARHLQGVTGPTITVPAGATSFEYPMQLGPRMEVGRTSRSCVLAVATVTDFDGSEHEVCFGSTEQNEQFVLLTDPPRLDVSAARGSIVAEPNGSLSLPVTVERGIGLSGPVTLTARVADHVRDVSTEEVTLPAGEEQVTIPLTFGPHPGPFNVPLVVRATMTDERGHAVVAETRIEIVPGGVGVPPN